MSEIVWGADIPIYRKMPDWLDRDAEIRVKWASNGVETVPIMACTFSNGHWVSGQIASISLPADHPHYKQGDAIAPEWAFRLAEKRLRDADTREGEHRSVAVWIVNAFARYIAEHEDAPVDPDAVAMRQILAAYQGRFVTHSAYADDNVDFQRALAAYKATKGGEG